MSRAPLRHRRGRVTVRLMCFARDPRAAVRGRLRREHSLLEQRVGRALLH